MEKLNSIKNMIKNYAPTDYGELTFHKLISGCGLFAKGHEVSTDDGYILKVFRLIDPFRENNEDQRPVFLQHGFLDSCECFVINSDRESLAIYLALKGYDVWLGNSRGNKYSTKHLNPDLTKNEYWDFSFQEMAKYDIPAVLIYVSKLSNNQKITYIGHS